jgi:hypothetical protein
VSPAESSALLRTVANLRTIRHVRLIDMRIDEEVLGSLSELAELRRLSIAGRTVRGTGPRADMPTDDEAWIYRAIGESKRLEALSIGRHAKIGGAGLEHLAAIPTLQHLRLEAREFDEESMAGLSRVSSLRELELPNAVLEAKSLRQLTRLPRLSKLTLRAPHADRIEVLTRFPRLTELTLYADPRAADIEALRNLPQLRSLVIVAPDR